MNSLSRRVDFGSAVVAPVRRFTAPTTRFEVVAAQGVMVEQLGERFAPIRRAHLVISDDGVLVNALTDRPILGWTAQGTNATIEATTESLGPVRVPQERVGAEATTHIEYRGTLPARAAGYDQFFYFECACRIHDGSGNIVPLTLSIVESPVADQWSWFMATPPSEDGPKLLSGRGTLVFDPESGRLIGGHSGRVGLLWADLRRRAVGLSLDFTSLVQHTDRLTDLHGVVLDGKPGIAVRDYRVESNGQVVLELTNGAQRVIGRLALASDDGRLTGGSVCVRYVR